MMVQIQKIELIGQNSTNFAAII